MTLEEIDAIRTAGLQLAIVYEYLGDREYYSSSHGRVDGYYAYHYAQQMHQPADSAIYFAIDYDPGPDHLPDIPGNIQAYLRGVLDGFNSFSNGQPVYKIGVYGAGVVCAWVRTHLPFVQYSWLAMSTGWTGRDSYKDWDVKQSKSTEDLCGLKRFRGDDGDYETNEIRTENFGQFTPGIHLV